jgi:uncharacterized protein YjcR
MATTPQRLNDRHEAAARLFAVGMRRADVARRLGYYPTTLSALRRSPAFQARSRELRRQLQAEVVTALADRIARRRADRTA